MTKSGKKTLEQETNAPKFKLMAVAWVISLILTINLVYPFLEDRGDFYGCATGVVLICFILISRFTSPSPIFIVNAVVLIAQSILGASTSVQTSIIVADVLFVLATLFVLYRDNQAKQLSQKPR